MCPQLLGGEQCPRVGWDSPSWVVIGAHPMAVAPSCLPHAQFSPQWTLSSQAQAVQSPQSTIHGVAQTNASGSRAELKSMRAEGAQQSF